MAEQSVSQLPELSDPYPLGSDQIRSYQEDGHILLREVAAPTEVAAYRDAILDAVERYKTETRSIDERETTFQKAFLQIMNLWRHDEIVQRFVLAQRFARIAAELMGVDGVRIYHDQALFKEPGGSHTPWHQDHFYWPIDTNNTITMWMPLVEATQDMGTMTFVSGSHRIGYLGQWGISDESEEKLQQLIEEYDLELSYAGNMAAGDATFHAGSTLHRALPNDSDRMREVMTIIYYADGARVKEPSTDAEQKDLERWLPGLQAGDLAATSINPLLYTTE